MHIVTVGGAHPSYQGHRGRCNNCQASTNLNVGSYGALGGRHDLAESGVHSYCSHYCSRPGEKMCLKFP